MNLSTSSLTSLTVKSSPSLVHEFANAAVSRCSTPDPGSAPEQVSYQLKQSLIAVGSGEEVYRNPDAVIYRIRRQFDALWNKENKRLGVTVTSAVELDPEIAKRIGKEIEEQTGNTVELESRVEPDILGGLVVQVGNMILDTSIRNRLEKLRKSVASAA